MQRRITIIALLMALCSGACMTSPNASSNTGALKIPSTVPSHMGAILLIDGQELGYDRKTDTPAFIESRLVFAYDLRKPEFMLVTYSKGGTVERTEVLARRGINRFYATRIRSDGVSILKEVSFEGHRWKYSMSDSGSDFVVEGDNWDIQEFLKKDSQMAHPGAKTEPNI